MRLGQRSLLFGVHQFVLHPLLVLLAWVRLYGRPSFKEFVCILVHDLGYWFADDIDGPEGSIHPEFGAALVDRWFGAKYRDLVLLHSRSYAYRMGRESSKLCWADKLSPTLEPWWIYLPRARWTGELAEYRQVAADKGEVPIELGDREWLRIVRKILVEQVELEVMNNERRSKRNVAKLGNR